METKQLLGSDLAFMINVHERLVRDFPKTPLNQWCRWVHDQKLSALEKRERILSWDLKPSEYANPLLFSADYQLKTFLSKFSSSESEDDTGEQLAYRKFLDSEDKCSSVNDLLMTRLRPSGINSLLEYAKKIIADCLRDVDEYFADFAEPMSQDPGFTTPIFGEVAQALKTHPDGLNFGPGVSVSAKGKSLRSTVEKLECGTVTANCWAFIKPIAAALGLPKPSLVKGSKLTFVHKKVGEMRAICFEPSVNMLFQKHVGRYMKKRLKAYFGINLKSQLRNQSLARLGSLTDSWATADLVSASDLNAYLLILELLPKRWFALLDALRSPGYTTPYSDEFSTFQKFSTMGNGFTFELETLVFAAISLAAIRLWGDPEFDKRDICVYGDDICVPKEHYAIVCQGLAVIGHQPNLSKSFSAGPFRESCGGDYFNGWDVTPLKPKELRLENPKTVIEVHNRLFDRSRDLTDYLTVGSWWDQSLTYVRDWIIRHYPRVSGGDVEFSWCKERQVDVPVTSNQWLWGVDRNLIRRHDTKQLVPKYLCVEKSSTIVEFHVPPTSASWLIALKQGATVLETTSIVFLRNKVNCAFGPSGSAILT